MLRPVNPTGRSFITNVYGAIAAKDKELTEKYKKEVTKLILKLGYKIEDVIGNRKMVSGVLALLVDDKTKEPKKLYTINLKVWNVEKELAEKVSVEFS